MVQIRFFGWGDLNITQATNKCKYYTTSVDQFPQKNAMESGQIIAYRSQGHPKAGVSQTTCLSFARYSKGTPRNPNSKMYRRWFVPFHHFLLFPDGALFHNSKRLIVCDEAGFLCVCEMPSSTRILTWKNPGNPSMMFFFSPYVLHGREFKWHMF